MQACAALQTQAHGKMQALTCVAHQALAARRTCQTHMQAVKGGTCNRCATCYDVLMHARCMFCIYGSSICSSSIVYTSLGCFIQVEFTEPVLRFPSLWHGINQAMEQLHKQHQAAKNIAPVVPAPVPPLAPVGPVTPVPA